MRTYTRWHWLIPALYAFATIALLFPLVRHVHDAVAETIGDPLLNAWTLRWVQHTLVTNPGHLYDGNIFAPNPRTLAFSELLLPQAILAWPVWLISHDALLAYNLSVIVTYPLCAVGMYALCRALGANRGAAFIAGLLYAFAPFRMDNTAHLQVLSMQWMPLALLAVIRLVQRPSWWRGAAITATMTLVALSSVYYAILFATGFCAFLLIEAIRQRRLALSRTGIGVLAALVIAAAIIAVIDAPYLTMRREQGIVRTLDEAYDDAAHRGSYVTVTPGSVVWGETLPTSGSERSALFPGALLLALALLGVRSLRRPWVPGIAALGVVGFVLSFGPTWGEKQSGIPLPYRFLFDHLVVYQGLRGPDRFAALVLLTLAVLAALGGTQAWHAIVTRRHALARYAVAVSAVGALIGVADVATRLLPTIPVDQSAGALAPYQWLAAHPQTGAVAEFPVERAELTTAFYSTYHWRPVLWGHSGFIPAATYHLRGQFLGRRDYPTAEDLGALADMGVRSVLIHRSAYTLSQVTEIDRQLASAPAMVREHERVGDTDIYRIAPAGDAVPITARATFATNASGNFGTMTGTLIITNTEPDARMLYTVGAFDCTVVIRNARGTEVARQPLALRPPAVLRAGTIRFPFTVTLPKQPGVYTVALAAPDLPDLRAQEPQTVSVIDERTLPNLTLVGRRITSPALYTPGEPVAMWVTTKGGATLPLPDATAKPDGTLDVMVTNLPAGAARIVAHGKTSGLELWVSPA